MTVRFGKPHRSRASGRVSLEHTVMALDGDIFQSP